MNRGLDVIEDGVVVLPQQSRAADVRSTAAENGRRSLFYFMTAILDRSACEDVCSFLQREFGRRSKTVILPARLARSYAEALALWAQVRGTAVQVLLADSAPVDPSRAVNETFKWLYGPAREASAGSAWILIVPSTCDVLDGRKLK